MTSTAPLEGIRVLDLSTMIAAPTCSTVLADYGAEVIKVENPGAGDHVRNFGRKKDGESLYWRALGRGKKSVALNLKDESVQELIRDWIKTFDVLIENFRPGTLEKWNLDPADLQAINPRLVVLRVTAYGQSGPYSERPGFGTLAEAMSGLPSLTGWEDRPPLLPPLPLADIMAGHQGASAVLAALRQRDAHSGDTASIIDLAIFESVLKLVEVNVIEYDQLGVEYARRGNVYGAAAPRGSYLCKDGSWVALSGSTQRTAMNLLRTIGGSELENDSRFATNETRLENVDALDEIIGAWCSSRPRSVVIETLSDSGCAVGPLESIPTMIENPQVRYRQSIAPVDDPVLGEVRMTNIYPHFSNWEPEPISPGASEVGADTESVLAEDFGDDWKQRIDRTRS